MVNSPRTLRQVTDVSSAEVGGLVHVDPEAVIGGQLVEGLQLLPPPLHSCLAQEVWKVCGSGPNLHQQTNLTTFHTFDSSFVQQMTTSDVMQGILAPSMSNAGSNDTLIGAAAKLPIFGKLTV